MNLKKTGKVFTSKFVGTGPSSYKKRIYRAAVSQMLRNTVVLDCALIANGDAANACFWYFSIVCYTILLGSTASLLCLTLRLTCQQTAFYARSVVYILRVILTVNNKNRLNFTLQCSPIVWMFHFCPFDLLVRAKCRWRWVWNNGGLILHEGKPMCLEKAGPRVSLSTTNSTEGGPGSNPSLFDERPGTNHLSHGTTPCTSFLSCNIPVVYIIWCKGRSSRTQLNIECSTLDI